MSRDIDGTQNSQGKIHSKAGNSAINLRFKTLRAEVCEPPIG
ncbi:hypothetical protein [uncultured Campylobacter sp.]|nr:hypothetical protein [uncultured Campylobacter sp.]